MELAEFLEASGWNKSQVARHIGVSKAAVGQWSEIPERYLEDLREVLVREIDPPKPMKSAVLSDLELLKVIRGRSKTTDWAICQSHGWRVPDFYKMIADLVAKYPVDDPFWRQVKIDTDNRK